MSQQQILLWHRNDLRLHDREPLQEAIATGAQIIPVYCLDPRHFGETSFGFPKTGAFRARFLLESLADLRSRLQSLGSNLIVRRGEPETVIPELARQLDIDAVYYQREVTSEEVAVEKALRQTLKPLGIKMRSWWGATLYHPENLPFDLTQIPEVFTQFRKRVEKNATIDAALPAPKELPTLPDIDAGTIPDIEDLGLEAPRDNDRAVMRFYGGETAGFDRLQAYFWEGDRLRVYKETRNGMLGADYSSKFSPWLALGCLSPRYIYEQVKEYERERIANNSTYWLVFELLWRDYFRFICAKHKTRVFRLSGLRGLRIEWKEDWERFALWQDGKTGYPLVDANMRELAATGFMSNRGRQNVASFLTKNLGINWQMGAEWFESLLVDYDVCSNWGNWNYTAGVGNDARGFRYFNIAKQSKDYDPNGEYIKHWLPELAEVPASKVREPWKLQSVEQKRFGVRLGVDYPNPVVDFMQSVRANERIYDAGIE